MSDEVTVLYRKTVTYTFVWHSLRDACSRCRMLNGHEFPEADIFRDRLWSPLFGDLWDLQADHTLVHPNCRCQLELRVHVDLYEMPYMTDLASIIGEML